MKPQNRCISIDWLEVYALEPIDEPHTADFFRGVGLDVRERDYGTRLYHDMFVIHDSLGYGLIEVRRHPKQSDYETGVLPINASHIRLTNRACYRKDAIQLMQNFLDTYHYTFMNIFRVDICLDFERFDSGDDPQSFIHRYIKRKYSKINQAEGHGHFVDRWDGRHWNSLGWGKPISAVTTKIYNKTLELKEAHDKPYIKQKWFEAGLIDHPLECYKVRRDGSRYTPVIWRLEFSIRSRVKNWLRIEFDGDEKKIRSIRNSLDIYNDDSKLLRMFATLQQHYFRFKHYQYGVLKSKCPDKELFYFDEADTAMKIEHPASNQKQDTDLMRLRRYLQHYRLTHYDEQVRNAVDMILEAIGSEDLRRYCENPYSRAELQALQLMIQARMAGRELDPVKMAKEIIDDAKHGVLLF